MNVFAAERRQIEGILVVVDGEEEGQASRSKLDKVLVPDPADQAVRVILVLCKPELALFANDIENLSDQVSTALHRPSRGTSNLPLRQHRSDMDSLPLSEHDQY